jgi:hypothetical protein
MAGKKTGLKLQKIDENLYHEPYKDDKYFKWEKRLSGLSLTIAAPKVELNLSIERSETNISLTLRSSERKDENQYSQSFDWRIFGVASLKDQTRDWIGDSIGLIKKDGSIGEYFDNIDVFLRPIANDHDARGRGDLSFMDGEYQRRNAYLNLDLYVPQEQLEKICDQLIADRLSALKLYVYVDTFESEVDYSLSEPEMNRRFYIEEGAYHNKAYLSWLSAFRVINDNSGSTERTLDKESADQLVEKLLKKNKFTEFWNFVKAVLIGLGLFYVVLRALNYFVR